MEIRRLDPHDDADAARWYTALRAGSSAGLSAPFVIAERAVLTSLRSNDGNPYTDRRAYGAWEGSRCLGAALLDLPRRDNEHAATIELGVPSEARRRGVGAALFAVVLAAARAEGRTVVDAQVGVVQGAALLDSPGGRFAASRGFRTVHTEQRLLLDLPVSGTRLDGLEQAARERSGGYRTVGWVGLPPRSRLEALAELQSSMESDVPSGDVDRAPVVHDAERVLAAHQRLLDQGYSLVTCMVLDPADSPVGYSTMFVAGEDVVQDDTFVLRAHRGRRLAALAKVVNLRRLARHFPQARHVHTWTAHTNDAMRSVNGRFGFRAVETVYEVELSLR